MPENTDSKTAYVYQIVVDGVVRYIGKGSGERADVHFRHARRLLRLRAAGAVIKETTFYNRLAAAIERGATIEARIIAVGLADEAAFEAEKGHIAECPKGQLWNIKGGGDGFSSDECYRLWTVRDRDVHSATMKAALADVEVRKTISERTKAGLTPAVLMARRETQKLASARPDVRAAKSAAMKQNWADPAYRSNVLASVGSEAVRARMSASARRRIRTPEEIAKMQATMKVVCSTPEVRSRLSEQSRKSAADPATRARVSAGVKRKWEDPIWKARTLAKRRAKREVIETDDH
jgi:hypothetical protein